MALRLLVSLQLRKSVVQSAFFRILLALELEPMFREEARERQRVGGKKKLWSNLAKASSLHVRSEIARIAGVSAGNVTKVKYVLDKGHAELIVSMKTGEVSIHKGHSRSTESPDRQIELLHDSRVNGDIRGKISRLLSKHPRKNPTGVSSASELADLIRDHPTVANGVGVEIIRGDQQRIFVTKGLMASLDQRGFEYGD